MDAEPSLSIITLTSAESETATLWLPRAEAVHRQLRDRLPPGFDAYRAVLAHVFAGGAHLSLVVAGETVAGLALWRIVDNTYELRRLYVDDLVVDAARRSNGIGRALLAWLEREARTRACRALALDSGVQRGGAHRFYFREGFSIPSFCFRKTLA
ncbi:MAG: GNAT family N-acetyltransferase [Azoarcus sp.]|jgi:GNAT superfamily N-acetyltransferase|nr:GNAT family N-acetyltransferase [Azoarcus sp.]